MTDKEKIKFLTAALAESAVIIGQLCKGECDVKRINKWKKNVINHFEGKTK